MEERLRIIMTAIDEIAWNHNHGVNGDCHRCNNFNYMDDCAYFEDDEERYEMRRKWLLHILYAA